MTSPIDPELRAKLKLIPVTWENVKVAGAILIALAVVVGALAFFLKPILVFLLITMVTFAVAFGGGYCLIRLWNAIVRRRLKAAGE